MKSTKNIVFLASLLILVILSLQPEFLVDMAGLRYFGEQLLIILSRTLTVAMKESNVLNFVLIDRC